MLRRAQYKTKFSSGVSPCPGSEFLCHELQSIRWTSHSATTLVQNMGVNHRRAYICMSKQFLDGTDVISIGQKMRCERMPEAVTCHPLRDTAPARRHRDCPLQNGLMQMVSPNLARGAVTILPASRKHPLPGPISWRAMQFHPQRMRKLDVTTPVRDIALVKPLCSDEMSLELRAKRSREDRHPILLPFPASYENRAILKVDILDT